MEFVRTNILNKPSLDPQISLDSLEFISYLEHHTSVFSDDL